MKLHLTFDFIKTEEEAKSIVKAENRRHPRRKHKASYTPYSTNDNSFTGFVVWRYY